MAVNNQNQHEAGDYRSRPGWSAGKKMDAVLRLLCGEPLEVLSRELGVEVHRLAAWRDDFLAGGKEGLKSQRADRSPDDRALCDRLDDVCGWRPSRAERGDRVS